MRPWSLASLTGCAPHSVRGAARAHPHPYAGMLHRSAWIRSQTWQILQTPSLMSDKSADKSRVHLLAAILSPATHVGLPKRHPTALCTETATPGTILSCNTAWRQRMRARGCAGALTWPSHVGKLCFTWAGCSRRALMAAQVLEPTEASGLKEVVRASAQTVA